MMKRKIICLVCKKELASEFESIELFMYKAKRNVLVCSFHCLRKFGETWNDYEWKWLQHLKNREKKEYEGWVMMGD